jgi:hypothetical protein
VNVENLTRNHGFCPILIQSFPGEFPLNQSKEIHIPGWWFQPEKYEFVSWDYYSILFPIYGKKCSKPPTRFPYCQRSPLNPKIFANLKTFPCLGDPRLGVAFQVDTMWAWVKNICRII